MKKLQTLSPCLLTVLIACGGGADPTPTDLEDSPFATGASAVVDAPEAERRAAEIARGDVLASAKERVRTLDVYSVDVTQPSGSVLEVRVVEDGGHVLEVECERYVEGELETEDGYIDLSEALARALEARPGDIVRWELELDDGLRWVFEVHLRTPEGAEIELEIDARTGEVVRTGDSDNMREPWDDEPHDLTALPEALRDAALDLVPGQIVKAEAETQHGLPVWKIDVRTASGAEVELRFLATSGHLYRAEGDEGPFDYDLAPSGLVSLSTAVTNAGFTLEDLEEWELRRRDGRLVWDLEIDDEEDVLVDARTGAVL